MPAHEPFRHRSRCQVDHADRPFGGRVANRIDPHPGALARRPGEILRARSTATEVAHECPTLGEYDVEGSHAYVECPPNLSCNGFEFQQLIRKVATDVEPGTVCGKGETGGNLRSPLRGVGRRQRQRVRRRHGLSIDRKQFDRAMHVAHRQPTTIRREDEARIALDRRSVGLEISVGGNGRWRRGLFRRRPHPGDDLAVGRLQDHNLIRLSRGRDQSAIG